MKKNKEFKSNHNNKFSDFSKTKYFAMILSFVLDVGCAVLAYVVARAILFNKVEVPSSYLPYELAIVISSITITIAMLVFFDCYNTVWKYAGRVEFFKFMLAYIFSFGIIMVLKIVMAVVFDVQLWSTLFILFLLFSAIMSGVQRFIYGIVNYVKHLGNWVNEKGHVGMKRTIVIGAGYTGSLVINRYINNPHEGYFPIALVDDDVKKHGQKVYGIKIEAGIDSIKEVCEKYKAEAIIIAIMSVTKSQLKRIYSKCAPLNLPIKIMPGITNADKMTNNALSLRDIKIDELLGREEFKVNQEFIDISVKDKVVCVTGGAGSIGSELCRQAIQFGCKHLVIFDVHENSMFELNQEFAAKYDTSKYTLVVGTVRERDKLREVFEKHKPNIVFHAAAYKHVPMMEIAPTEAIKNNVFGTLNVIEQCNESGVEKFVLISTDKAVNPANIMGASKRIAEMVIETMGKTSKTQLAAVRFGNVLGSNGSVIPIFLKQIKEGGPITLTDRNIKRYFMTIPEAVRLVLQTGAIAKGGEVFVLDMGDPVFIYDLACDLIRINGYVPEEDIEIKITGLRPGEKLFEELRYDKETVDKTVHEGIFVTNLEDISVKDFSKQLEKLKKAAFSESEERTTEEIFSIVPATFRNMAREEQLRTKECIENGGKMRE